MARGSRTHPAPYPFWGTSLFEADDDDGGHNVGSNRRDRPSGDKKVHFTLIMSIQLG